MWVKNTLAQNIKLSSIKYSLYIVSFLLRTRLTKQNLATVEVLDVGEAEDYEVSVGKYILTRFWKGVSADKDKDIDTLI